MKKSSYNIIILFISITILATISVQIFWNVKNYQENKTRFVSDVQAAFDNGIELYYSKDALNQVVAFVGKDGQNREGFFENVLKDSAFTKSFPKRKLKGNAKVTAINFSETSSKETKSDELVQSNFPKIENPSEIQSIQVLKGRKEVDSISGLENLVNKIIISVRNDSIDFNKLSQVFELESARKNINVDYEILQVKDKRILANYQSNNQAALPLMVEGNSGYLRNGMKLKLKFSNPVIQILQRSIMEIILSLVLSSAIIFCLIYLLNIIKHQKKADEIKNDLISNITHEFKTPITTVATALEALKHFNENNDPEKTRKYLDISQNQLKKLELIVEKLLETASIDTEKLMLKKETNDLVLMVKNLCEKHQIIAQDKVINFVSEEDEIVIDADFFHLENAISNLIDNAVKYGGNEILVRINFAKAEIKISVSDNGKGIDKSQSDKVFDKFYRIPKGNLHDVKGFGIGLFYAKKIIEKHNGSLELLSCLPTTFLIILPNEGKN
ncbi:sensor histidine kinase [Flavobacterium sp. NST-5]|uniref:histidine kinase n=1 Tax=Flavobacterium ichthyis TaxID=2698827 RepID=A0ABW9Z6B2_9FLAO|nr:HAMP domain-containing sensor histidine kinase [Flavobacterium ichthyis]NBL63776.1 sensor histidine kinase [Flavobacterium ichthyis]